MDRLPPEVLRIICTHLNFDDAANVRFLTHTLADVAAEVLVTRVRFHTSHASLERLEKISRHPIFSQTVKILAYEAALLADVKSRHEYAKHFELEHHGLERPKEPPLGCSEREGRLHARNKQKWLQDIYRKYDIYRGLFESQKSLLDNGFLEKTMSQCIPRFRKLGFIDVDPVRRCSHMTSKRFIEEFGSDCASPLSGNFSKVGDQFKHMLFPNNSIIPSLRKLEINALSPNFFKSSQRELFKAAFRPLTLIDIVLKLADRDLKTGEDSRDCFHRHLSNGVLRDALSAATNLEVVSIGVESAFLVFADVSDIFSDSVWRELWSVSFSTLSTTQDRLMQFLKRQPSLKWLSLTLMQLTQGTWVDALEEMRQHLELGDFIPSGFLEDPQESWPMDLINMEVYEASFEEHDLGSAIGMYVVREDTGLDEGEPTNPLVDGFVKYEEADMVRDLFGTMSDLSASDVTDSNLDDEMALDDTLHEDSSFLTPDTDVLMPDIEPSN